MLFFFRLKINTTTTTISPIIITADIDATIIIVLTFSKEKRGKSNENITKSLIVQGKDKLVKNCFVTATRLYPCVQGKTQF